MAGIMGHLINTQFFWKAHSGGCNVFINVGDSEPPESAIRRLRKAIMSADVINECRRRRSFESTQDLAKRKASTKKMALRNKPKTFSQKRAETALNRARMERPPYQPKSFNNGPSSMDMGASSSAGAAASSATAAAASALSAAEPALAGVP
eukprot:jgi/Chlat1/6738/Chrsp50S06436